MPLDGLYLNFLKNEIQSTLLAARIEKIAQPSRDELVLTFRSREGSHKLLLCGGASNPRLHLTQMAPENPKTPPMFCMLLRKHLGGARLAGVRQQGLDRILHLDFEATNELGDPVTFTVTTEIMGRHSNVIVMDGEQKILDSLRRVDFDTSRVRQILPGMRYALPPAQQKESILEKSPAELVDLVRSGREQELSKALMEHLEGFSLLVCREAAHYTARGLEITNTQMTAEQAGRLRFYLGGVADALRGNTPTPTMLSEPGGRPKDFCGLPVTQYGTARITREYPGVSALLDAFYTERDRAERVRQRSGDLLTLLASLSERVARRVANQREELKECQNRKQLKQMGDLLMANLYQIAQGDAKATVQNFYDPAGGEVTVELDPQLTPTQNAQRYYALYRKADTAEQHLTRLIAAGEEELVYVDSVFDALTRADGEAELEAIRRELAASGYLRSRHVPAGSGKNGKTGKAGGRPQKEQKLPPLRYRSTDGFVILCGRNNVQNDRLTIKEAAKTDLWLHTQKIPGSHVIVLTGGEQVPNTTIEQAAVIAAYNSKARESSKVPVDFTQVRNVKKPNGSKPGMVIYETYQTVLVDPDAELVASLAAKD